MHDRNLRNASRNRHTGTCVNSILFGNGLNLLSEDCPTWKELLSDITDKDNAPILRDPAYAPIRTGLSVSKRIILRTYQ